MNFAGGATSLDRQGEVPIGTSEMGSVVTVLSPTGGVGASTVATNLAVRLASKLGALRPEVALMDTDLAFGCATSMVGARPPRSLADLIARSPLNCCWQRCNHWNAGSRCLRHRPIRLRLKAWCPPPARG